MFAVIDNTLNRPGDPAIDGRKLRGTTHILSVDMTLGWQGGPT